MANERRLIPPDIEQMIVESGVTWEVRNGGKHRKLFIEGQFISPLSLSPMKMRTIKNFRARIKRHLDRIAGQKPKPKQSEDTTMKQTESSFKDLPSMVEDADGASKSHAVVDMPENLRALIDLVGTNEAAEATGYTPSGLRTAISNGNVRKTLELAAKAVMLDLADEPEPAEFMTIIVHGGIGEMAELSRAMKRYDVSVTPIEMPRSK